MTSEVSERQRSIQFNRDVPNSAAVVVNAYEVPGAFTRRGWDDVSSRFARPERFFQAEPWVLEGSSNVPVERTALVEGLRSRYVADYTRQWRAYLTSASVVGYANVADAANKLRMLSENQSPLLTMLSLASQNTAVDAPGIAQTFQPVQAVTPPNSGGRPRSESQQGLEGGARQHPPPLQTRGGA